MEDKLKHTSHEPSKLSYDLIKQITTDFQEELGRGGFGTVYKGVKKSGEEIAVKVLHPDNSGGLDDTEFQKEFDNLRGLKHQNVVQLVGFCNEIVDEPTEHKGEQVTARVRRALCFEYVDNGSLNKLISDQYGGLDWDKRYKIIKGVCEGLKYLCEGLKDPIIHLDLKPENILLDKNMVAKISDFGISRLIGQENTKKNYESHRHNGPTISGDGYKNNGHEMPLIGGIAQTLNETETMVRCELLLDVHPLELCFPFMPSDPRKKAMFSCSLQLSNKDNDRIAFMLVANNPKRYFTKKPLCGVVPPGCVYTLILTMPKQPPSPSDSGDLFTLYSIAVGEYELGDVDKDSASIKYDDFFKKAKENRVASEEVYEVTLKALFDRPAQGTSSEIIIMPDAKQVSSIDVHPTEPWIMTTNNVGSLRVWDYNTMTMLDSFQLATYEPVYAAKFIAHEKWLVAGDGNGVIHVHNYDKKQLVESFDAHDTCITTLAVHPTRPFILSSSSEDDDHLIKLWHWDGGWKNTRTFQGHSDKVTQVTFNPEDNNSFASASSDRTVKIWSISSDDPSCITTLKLQYPESLLCVDYFRRQNRQNLIVGCKDKTAQIWKLGMNACFDKLEGHAGHISAVKLHPELPLLITGSLDGTVRLWNSTTYKLENIIGFNLGAVYAFECIKDSRRIVVGCHHGIAMVEISLPEKYNGVISRGE